MGIVAAYAVPHPPLAMPEVGRGQERAIQDTLDAYREVARRIAAHAPETIVAVSYTHLRRRCPNRRPSRTAASWRASATAGRPSTS